MARIALEQAYPGISIRPRSRRLWARLMRWPAECVHLEHGHHWMATFIPDTLYLRGKPRLRRDPARPEVSVCIDCLTGLLQPELAACPSRVIAFEPDGETFTQYFFLGREDFDSAGLRSEVAAAIETRLEELQGPCSDCDQPATWLWISRREVSSLDQTERIEELARRAVLRKAWRRETVRGAGTSAGSKSVLRQRALRRFRRVRVDLKW